jgi:zinc and cadmium transporter
MIGVISLCGVITIPINKKTLSTVIFILLSLGTGAMLGNALVHLVPESFEHATNPVLTSVLCVCGFMSCFVLQKLLHLRMHCAAIEKDDKCRGHECHAGEEHAHEDAQEHYGHIHPTGYMSLVSHALDNLTDGIIIGTSYLISPAAGFATSLAVILHEIPMEFGGFGVLVFAGFSRKGAVLVNFLSALVAVLGTVLILWLGTSIAWVPGVLTPIAAGMVLFIAAAGLTPQLLKEPGCKRSLAQLALMLVGITAMVLVKFLD